MLLTSHDLLKLYCAATNKWGVYFAGWRFYEPKTSACKVLWGKYLQELDKTRIFIDKEDPNFNQVDLDDEGFCIFDTEEEMRSFYDKIVGDDGPTESNPYDGPITIYALSCGPNGFMNENT